MFFFVYKFKWIQNETFKLSPRRIVLFQFNLNEQTANVIFGEWEIEVYILHMTMGLLFF